MSVKKKRKMIKLDMNKVSVKHSLFCELFCIQCETYHVYKQHICLKNQLHS